MNELKYNGNKFKICQLTDIHLEADGDIEKYNKTLKLVNEILENTSPDLVVITGDISWGQQTAQGVRDLAEIFEKKQIKWAPVLGNHDGNPGDSDIKTREEFAELLTGYNQSLFEFGEIKVDGNGNYNISVVNSKNEIDWVLFFLDSHQGDFYPTQIDWYRKTSSEISDNHKELAFFHVPIPEYWEVWNFENCKGFNQENICTTHHNDGLFSAFVRAKKMRGVFVGHDHINDFEGTLHNIRLCYGRATGYQCYGLEGFPLGARIIELNNDDFETSIYLAGGEIYKQESIHRPLLKRKH